MKVLVHLKNIENPVLPKIKFLMKFGIFFIVKLLTQLHMYIVFVRIGILLTCGKHLHNCIISLIGEVWTHITSLTLPLLLCLY